MAVYDDLGRRYEFGIGAALSDAEAARCYGQAARLGNLHAQHNLGILYESGRGVAQSDDRAACWLGLAARQGDARAQFRLASLYRRYAALKQGLAEVMRLLQLAADQGLADAQVDLGQIYSAGAGIPKRPAVAAASWFRRAAIQGHAPAQAARSGSTGLPPPRACRCRS